MRRLVLLSLCLSFVTCKLPFKKRDAGVAPPDVTAHTLDPLTPHWSDFDLKFAELSSTALAYFTVSGTSYELRFSGFPAGTTLTLSGKTTPLSTASYSQRIDIGDKIALMSPSDALGYTFKLDPKIAFTIETPGYRATPLSAPPRSVSYAVKDSLSKAIDHPVLFSGEAASDPPLPTHSIIYTGMIADTYGPAVTLRDVDWIAVMEKLPAKKGKVCAIKPLPGARGPAITSTTLDMIDEQISIVERKTSKLVSKKTFTAKTDCPTYASGATSQTFPDEAEIKRWVRDERSK
jgi:hypothetical protein